MEDSRDESKTGSGVDQGADNLEPPRAIYTSGGDLPRTGYEPKPSSTRVVGGVPKQTEDKKNPIPSTTSTASVPCASRESGKAKREQRLFEEPLSVRLGQSESRDYGTEIFELEEKSKILQLTMKKNYECSMRRNGEI